jgi:aspartyl-tRNA(Asn)/glutamyl-tRNA(Gln) amidotransferase subunit B
MTATPASAWQPVIGLEVHAELQTRSKMFCGCAVVDSTLAAPNSSTCEVCIGLPGTLPVLNARAVEYAIRVGLALGCSVPPTSVFARKNYFYPDLPKGYQISQFELPLAVSGLLAIQTASGPKPIRIRRVHLEEDTGKLSHRDGFSLVDYNRSGVPLVEIVSEPDLESIDDVKAYATGLRSLLRYLEVSSGDMEKGVIRFEANVSMRPTGSGGLGTRTEIKNLNSFRSMLRALAFEIDRQSQLLSAGGQVAQETLGWDDAAGIAYSQRGKEEAHDYRYFPEPDLPPLVLDAAWVEQIRASLPELPSARRERFERQYGLSAYLASVLTAERETAGFFEAAAAAKPGTSPERIAHWLTGELFGQLHEAGIELEASAVGPAMLADLVELIESGAINASSGKTVLAEMLSSGRGPREVVHGLGLAQISDPGEIDSLIAQVLRLHPAQMAEYRAGKAALAQWFFGQVMRAAGGRTNPGVVRERLEAALHAAAENHTSS